MSVVINSYQTCEFKDKDYISNDAWYFIDEATGVVRKKRCFDVDFFLRWAQSNTFTRHQYSHIANYFDTRVRPYIPREVFARFYDFDTNEYTSAEYRSKFDFSEATDASNANEFVVCGDYVYWPALTVRIFGWLLYLKLNFDYELSRYVPLPCHEKLDGQRVCLITNQVDNMDIFTQIVNDDELLFSNGPYKPSQNKMVDVMRVETRRDGYTDFVTVRVSDRYVVNRTKVVFSYLVENETFVDCHFVPEFKMYGDVDLTRMRSVYVEGAPEPMETDCEEELVEERDMRVSPSSNFSPQFDKYIIECLQAVNQAMVEADNQLGADALMTYLMESSCLTLPYLAVNAWQYCMSHIKIYNQYTLEDILMFMHTLCGHVSEKHQAELYKYHQIYVSSKENAQKFFDSLNFFADPQRCLGYYFAVHNAVHRKYGTWTLTATNVSGCELMPEVISFGYFKKIKHNEISYIFNGNVYEFVKNRKEHPKASLYDKAEEIQVSMFKFNNILNFYLTEDGMFDVCQKAYRPACPFVVLSALKKNYILPNENYVPSEVFELMYNAMKTDVDVLRAYHAKKFEEDVITTRDNLHDCMLLGDSFTEHQTFYTEKLRMLMCWVMQTNERMLMLLMKKYGMNAAINNLVSDLGYTDTKGLQVAVVLNILQPKSAVAQYAWGLLREELSFFAAAEYEVVPICSDYSSICTEEAYRARLKIIDALAHYIARDETFARLMHDSTTVDGELLKIITSVVAQYNPGSVRPQRRRRARLPYIYNKVKRLDQKYGVWTDKLIKAHAQDDMYSWLTRFYKRVYLKKVDTSGYDDNLITNFVQGMCYFRILTNFNTTSSKAIMHFCASLAIPTDYEKMCLVISSEPNCGKSSLFELLDKLILVFKSDRAVYDHMNEDKVSKIKRFESQLYIMNEAEITTKGFLKNIADSTKFDSTNRKYGPEELFYANYKVMITTNEMLYVRDGYDKACSNRIGQIYIDHVFDSDITTFGGSIYEYYEQKRYHEVKNINMQLISPVRQFLANVLYYRADPKTGYVFYKSILTGDKCYKHNKSCLHVYNNRMEALKYVLRVEDNKPAKKMVVTGEQITDMINRMVPVIQAMVHKKARERIDGPTLLSDFQQKYKKSKYYTIETNSYTNLSLALDEKRCRTVRPKFKSEWIDDGDNIIEGW